MLSFSPSAQHKFKSLAAPIRIGVSGGGCAGYTFQVIPSSRAKDYDLIFSRQGITFICDPKSYQYLSNVFIDYHQSLNYTGFILNGENIAQACGCGKSIDFK